MEKINTCPVSNFTIILGGKWKLPIINTVRKAGKIRFGKLHASIPGISRKVLTDQLRELAKSGLIIKEIEFWSNTFIKNN